MEPYKKIHIFTIWKWTAA